MFGDNKLPSTIIILIRILSQSPWNLPPSSFIHNFLLWKIISSFYASKTNYIFSHSVTDFILWITNFKQIDVLQRWDHKKKSRNIFSPRFSVSVLFSPFIHSKLPSSFILTSFGINFSCSNSLGICRLCNDMFIYAECIFYFCLMKNTAKEYSGNNFQKVNGKKTKLNAMIHSQESAKQFKPFSILINRCNSLNILFNK